MGAYATRDDVYTLALSAQAFVTRPRTLEDFSTTNFNPSTGVIRLVGHGLSANDQVYLTVVSGGSLPGGAAALTVYYPLPISSDLLKLSATPNGSPLTFGSAGQGWSIAVDSGRRLDGHLLEAAAEIDEHLTAHVVPIALDPITSKYPQVLIGLNARMAARQAVTSLQIENAQYKVAVDRLVAKEEFDKELLADWKAGKPIQPRPDEGKDEDNTARASNTRKAIDWSIGYL